MPIEIALMIEGQAGLTWPRWQRVARAAEDLGFVGLYRSDHYTNAAPPDQESLELWVSLTWLASHTSRIEFGPMVSPMSFRHPSTTARMAMAVDDLSDGRLILGLGAGWQAREHDNFGLDLLELKPRFQRFEEGLEVISRLMRDATPQNFNGAFYQLKDAVLLPRTQRAGGPPILIGGNGANRTLGLVARYAAEWNAVFVPAQRFSELNARLDTLLARQGRVANSVRRSLMTGCWYAQTDAELSNLLARRNVSLDQVQSRGMIVGTAAHIRAQLDGLAAAGVQRVLLQWLNVDDIDGLTHMAKALL